MKKIKFIALFITGTLINREGYCQQQTKLDFYLASKKNDFLSRKSKSDALIPLLIKGNIKEIQSLVQGCNGIFKYSYGNIAAIKIPANALAAFEASASVIRMEGKPPVMRPLNDTMRTRNHIVEVQMGMTPLTQGYNGTGIVIGFVDTGIDFTHPDFMDGKSSNTRIQFLWDMNRDYDALYTPEPYNYGQAFNAIEIEAGANMDTCGQYGYGHGSNVAGVATGNGLSNGLNMGACPKADIIMVSYNFNSQQPDMLTDGISYIFNMAQNVLKEPCVINLSLGDYQGSHDGYDLQAQMIDSMIYAYQPGRVVVAAAGNNKFGPNSVPGKFHVHTVLNPGDTSFTWYTYDSYTGNVYISIYADTSKLSKTSFFSIGVDKAASGDYVFNARTGFSTLASIIKNGLNQTLDNKSGQPLGTISGSGQLNGTVYSLVFTITPDSTSYYWRLISTGNGYFDSWGYDEVTVNVVDTTGLNISSHQFPSIKQYVEPDTIETVCSSFQCSPEVITVGNYINRKTYIDYNHHLDSLNYIPGENDVIAGNLVVNSCVGPTRTGLGKPDISASGNFTLSTFPLGLRQSEILSCPGCLDSLGFHNMDGGTSLACPVVAATAALYIEKNPTATWEDVRNAIVFCADADKFTGNNLPNNQWGYGKVDAFKALTQCYLGVNDVFTYPQATLSIFPNPFKESAQITYDFSPVTVFMDARITLYDVMGKEIKTIHLEENKGIIGITKGNLASGIYFYSLVVDGKRLITEKLEVM